MSDTAFVLIAEDERAHGEAVAEALRRSGFACNLVTSGPDAMASIHQRPPDVVVADYKLGGPVNGMDVLREAKRKGRKVYVHEFGQEGL